MRVVAVGAEVVGSLAGAGKVSRPFPVDTRLPILIYISVTFATKPMAFGEVDQLPIEEPQFIPVSRIVTIEAPPHGLCMMQPHTGMLFL